MKLPSFAYHCPTSIDAALSLLAQHGDEAKVLAGGQSLVPLLALRLARPEVVVDIGRINGLADIGTADGRVAIGTLVRERAAERSDVIRQQVPLLAEALPLIGHAAIRNRGTIGGSVAHSDPAAEIPAVLLAAGGEVVATSAARGERVILANDFFLGHFTTALEPDELLTEVRMPKAASGTGAAFREAVRRHGDFAIVGAAAMVRLEDERIAEARIALIGVGSTALRRPEAEQLLAGATPTTEAFTAAGAEAARGLDPPSDLHGTADYRRKVAAVMVRRALQEASERATGSGA